MEEQLALLEPLVLQAQQGAHQRPAQHQAV